MPRLAPGLALLAAVTLIHEPAAAAWPPGGNLLGSSYFGSLDVRVDPDSAGGVAIRWMQRGGNGGREMAARILAGGATLYEVDIFGIPVSSSMPCPVFESAGGVYFAYSNTGEIYLLRVLADGTLDGAYGTNGLNVTGTPSTYEQLPATASDGAGGAYVSWTNASPLQLVVKRFQASGTAMPGWPAGGVVMGPGGIDAYRLMPDGAGGVLGLWSAFSGSGPDAHMQRVDPSGTIALGWPASGLQLAPGVAQNRLVLPLIESGSEHVFAAWYEPSTGDITVQRVGLDGSIAPGWPAGGQHLVQAGEAISNARLISDGADGAYLVWRTSVVRALRVLPDGNVAPGWPAGGKSVLDAAAVSVGGFDAAPGASNGLVVAWNDGRHPEHSFARVRWLLADGSADPSQPDSGRVVDPEAQHPNLKGMATDGAGGAFVVWDDGVVLNENVDTKLGWLPYPIPLGVGPHPPMAGFWMTAPRPNPAMHEVEFTVTLVDGAPAHVEMIDLAGRRVRSVDVAGAGAHAVHFADVTSLPAGVYFIRVSQGNRSVSDRVAIVH